MEAHTKIVEASTILIGLINMLPPASIARITANSYREVLVKNESLLHTLYKEIFML